MSLEALIQVLVSGILVGGLYALVAFGLSIIYGVVRILNFAHGTLLAIGGVLASVMFTQWGVSPWLIGIGLAALFFVFGYVFYVLLLLPLAKRNHYETTVGTVLVTVGALLLLSDITAKLAGSSQRNIRIFSDVLEFGDVIVSLSQVYVLIGVIVFTIALHQFLQRSWFGRAVRAVTQDSLGAQICGVESNRLRALTFAFGSSVVAVAAVLYAISFPVDPYMGFGLTVKAFTLIVLGGIGNLPGALAAGVLLGVAEGLTGFFFRPEWAPALSVILLLGMLVLFPRGVWGTN